MAAKPFQLRRGSGMALMMVIAVVALASVLGFAMLSSAALQSRTAYNAQRAGSAEYLIESGINLAMYYLQYPEKAPLPLPAGYWQGTTGAIAINAGVPGTVHVSVVRDATNPWIYEIESTGAITAGAATISKKGGCRVYVRNQFVAKSAAAFNHSVQINANSRYEGNVYCASKLSMRSMPGPAPVITGVGYCNTFQAPGVGWVEPVGKYSATLVLATSVSPVPSQTFTYYPKYVYAEQEYNAGVIVSAGLPLNTLTGAVGVLTRGSSASNPAGIWYCDASSGGALVLGENCTIDGSLIVKGSLQLKGKNIRITSATGYPALIVTGDLETVNPSNSAILNGVVFVGGQLRSSFIGTTTPLTTLGINGALLGGNSITPIHSSFNAMMTVKHEPNRCVVPDLSWQLRSPMGVSVLRWGLPR